MIKIKPKILLIAIWTLLQAIVVHADELKIATYNVGMLDTFVSSVPLREEREVVFETALLEFVEESDVDILAVQEAWTNFSVEALSSLHPDYTYFDSVRDRKSALLEHKTGLGFLVKNSLNATSSFLDFESRESVICGFGRVCDRGLLVLSFVMSDKTFFVLNTHLTPVYNYGDHRERQINELNLKKFELLMNHPSAEVIITGDFNVSPEFGSLRDGDDGTVEDWENNASLFSPLLEGYGIANCLDTYNEAQDNLTLSPYTQDRDENNLTAFSSATKVEPNQRIDHIIYCSPRSSVKPGIVNSIEHFFTQRFDLPSGEYELSDHYGVMVKMTFQ